jgi:acyl transferase domain-containing protein/NAD(P)-dependent dehydrogenase (short-subunit alcohol dehydrogenase family)
LNLADPSQPVPVAIIGIGCLFPHADDWASFWSNIRSKLDAIGDVPPTHWSPADYWDADPKAEDRTYARRGGFLTPVEFPLLDFGIAPNAIEATDTTQLLGLMVARQALEDAGYAEGNRLDRKRVNVILGVTGTLELVIPLGARLGHPIWRRALQEANVPQDQAEAVVRRIADSYVGWQESSFPGLLGNVVAGRIANRLDLRGTNCVVDAACASSLGAVHLALLELATGRCDLALTGGLDTFNDIFMYMCFSKTPALSPTGDIRPFDAAADGTLLGEGLGILVLKRLEDARRDGDRIYAVIRAMGTSSDGKGQAVYAPSAAGQIEALRQACELAQAPPETIELVEAHGTGTRVGDAIELEALEAVYGPAAPGGPWCALGSVKSQIGHTKAAAGAAGLIKAALALYHKVLPPTIKVQNPIESLARGDSPFYVSLEPRPWLSKPGHPRRAGVSSFGFGGSNFHCLLEEAEPVARAIDWGGEIQILAYSGNSASEVEDRLPAWSNDVGWTTVREQAAVCREEFRASDPHRLVLIAHQGVTDFAALWDHARRSLRAGEAPATREDQIRRRSTAAGDSLWVRHGFGPPPGRLVLLFPGQGSQYLEMFRELSCRFPAMHQALEQGNRLADFSPLRLSDLIYPIPAHDPETRLRQAASLRDTRIAQPALAAVSLGLLDLLRSFGVEPEMVGGHSFGELVALYASGRIDGEDFFSLAVRRGALMAERGLGSDLGAMLAVLAPAAEVESLIREHSLDAVVANKNAPRQVVLSGPVGVIRRASSLFSSLGIASKQLDVSAAFHSPLVAGCQTSFRSFLDGMEWKPARIPVFANATGTPYPDDPQTARELLASQLARPVEFVAQIEAMHLMGGRTFLEVGPDSKLTGLVRSILEGREHVALSVDASRGAGPSANLLDLAVALATLAVLGYPVDLKQWDYGFRPRPRNSSRKGLTVQVCGAHPAPARREPAVPAISPRPNLEPQSAPRSVPARERIATFGADQAYPRSGLSASRNGDEASTVDPVPRAAPNPNPSANGQSSRNGSQDRKFGSGRMDIHEGDSQPPNEPQELVRLFEKTQENILALQRLAEQTSRLHQEFLDGQETAQRAFQLLLEHQQRLAEAKLGAGQALLSTGPPRDTQRGEACRSSVDSDRLPRSENTPMQATPQRSQKPASPEGGAEFHPMNSGTLSSSHPSATLEGVLIEVVSEKTGYPADLLDLDMQLDSDLGIDSIKRVEILSGVQERMPHLPTVSPETLGSFRSLRQILEALEPSSSAGGTTAPPEPTTLFVETQATASPRDLVAATLIEVVGEKTGYPADLLDLDMQLDSDLGIDSIKRVEILSGVQERMPHLPTVDPDRLGSFRTLRQILEFLEAGSSKGTQTPEAATAAEPRFLEVGSEDQGNPGAQPADQPLRVWTPQPVSLDPTRERNRPSLVPEAEIWVSDDGTGLGAAVCASLGASGLRGRLFRSHDWRDLEGLEQLAGLIILAPVAAEESCAGAALEAFRMIRAAARGLNHASERGGSVLLTVSRLDGAFGLGGVQEPVSLGSAALLGMVKTASREWPQVRCKALDLDAGFRDLDAAASWIVEELLRDGPLELGMSPRGTVGVQLAAVDRPCPALPLRRLNSGDLVVISGGARGITAEVAVALAAEFQPQLVLLGRTPPPAAEPEWLLPLRGEAEIKEGILRHDSEAGRTPQSVHEAYRKIVDRREIARTLARIAACGGSARYHAVDIRNAFAVSEAIGRFQAEAGPVRGLIHGAGVLADRRIEDQTEEQFARVFATKVEGIHALFGAVDPSQLRFLYLFSSSTARFGRAGQIAYAPRMSISTNLPRSTPAVSRDVRSFRSIGAHGTAAWSLSL